MVALDFTFAVLDTEGHIGNMHDISIAVVSLSAVVQAGTYGVVKHSCVDIPTITNKNAGRYAGTIIDTLNRGQFIVAHNISTDRLNVEAALNDAGFGKEIPEIHKWRDSFRWLRTAQDHPDSNLLKKEKPANLKMGTLNKALLKKDFVNQHKALGDTHVLVQIIERMFLEDLEMFLMLFPRSMSNTIRAVRNKQIEPPEPRNALPPLPTTPPPSALEPVLESETVTVEVPSCPPLPSTPPPVVVDEQTPSLIDPEVSPPLPRSPPPEMNTSKPTTIKDLSTLATKRVNGPFTLRCMKTCRPVRNFYTWAWDVTAEKIPTKALAEEGVVTVREGEHIILLAGTETLISYVRHRQQHCVGVYNNAEQLLRLF